jgi:hypothetical protein
MNKYYESLFLFMLDSLTNEGYQSHISMLKGLKLRISVSYFNAVDPHNLNMSHTTT